MSTSILQGKKVFNQGVPIGPLVDTSQINYVPPQEYTTFNLTPCTSIIGAEIQRIRLNGNLSAPILDELKQALLDWKVLFFREQNITPEEHKKFAYLFGQLEEHPFVKFFDKSQKDDEVVSFSKGPQVAGFENYWHNDVTWRENPSQIAILRAVEVPQIGGDTLWNDMAAAYENLSDSLQEEIEHLYAYHDWTTSFGRIMPQDKIAEFREQFPVAEHPIVRFIPETKKKVLFVNGFFTISVKGYSPEESQRLLNELYRQIYRPEYQVRLKWEKDTVAMWDNRACQHYASSDYFPHVRKMQRLSIIGEKPLGIQALS